MKIPACSVRSTTSVRKLPARADSDSHPLIRRDSVTSAESPAPTRTSSSPLDPVSSSGANSRDRGWSSARPLTVTGRAPSLRNQKV